MNQAARLNILSMLAILVFNTASFAQAVWTVCDQGCNYTSINAAIDAAEDGDGVADGADLGIIFATWGTDGTL